MGRGKVEVDLCMYIKKAQSQTGQQPLAHHYQVSLQIKLLTSNEGYKQIGTSFMLDQNQKIAVTMTTNRCSVSILHEKKNCLR